MYSDESYIQKRFYRAHGKKANLTNPKTLNEKIQWMKLNFRDQKYIDHADKFKVREYISNKFGDEYLIPLVWFASNSKDLTSEVLPDFPFVVKCNHDSGNYRIYRSKNDVDILDLKFECRKWLSQDYSWIDREWQYSKMPRKILIEKLLLDENGKIPNDYKLNFINGELEFVYVSVDREGGNYRNIYDSEWKPLYFHWTSKKNIDDLRGPEIQRPHSFSKMIEIGQEIAKEYPYVRVDFYDINGDLFVGEITHFHGGGFDRFYPAEYDLKFGKKLKLSI